MRKFVVIIALYMSALGGVPSLAEDFPSYSDLVIETSQGRHHFRVEVAADSQSRAIGLMFREHLDGDAGMLFDFKRTMPIAMWMKNTYIPLDMLFISREGHVVYVAERTVPHSLKAVGPKTPVYSVLELNAGTVDRLNISIGDSVHHKIFD